MDEQQTEHAGHLRRAVELARHGVSVGDGGPFGALVVLDGEVIAEGWNQVVRTNDPTAHAEVVAVRAACRTLGHFELPGAVVYASCEPCPMCLATLYWARPAGVWFAATKGDAASVGFDDAQIYEELSIDPAQRSLPFRRLEVPGAREVFAEWQTTPGRIEY